MQGVSIAQKINSYAKKSIDFQNKIRDFIRRLRDKCESIIDWMIQRSMIDDYELFWLIH